MMVPCRLSSYWFRLYEFLLARLVVSVDFFVISFTVQALKIKTFSLQCLVVGLCINSFTYWIKAL